VSPATTPIVSGRKRGITTISAAAPTNSPFWLTWSRKAGPRPGRGDDDSRMATAIRIGMAASASSSA
jgi:hypothetical protein